MTNEAFSRVLMVKELEFSVLNLLNPKVVRFEEVKRSSSKWMKADGAAPGFTWRAGYGAFSIGESQADAAIHYIQNQEEHHRRTQAFALRIISMCSELPKNDTIAQVVLP